MNGLNNLSSLSALSGPNVLLQELKLFCLPALTDISSLSSLSNLKKVIYDSCDSLVYVSSLRNVPFLSFRYITAADFDLVTSLVGDFADNEEQNEDVEGCSTRIKPKNLIVL
jgi:hypothetical protein